MQTAPFFSKTISDNKILYVLCWRLQYRSQSVEERLTVDRSVSLNNNATVDGIWTSLSRSAPEEEQNLIEDFSILSEAG